MKRILSLSIAALMLLVCLAGCNNTSASPSPAAPSGPAASPSTASTPSQEPGAEPLSGKITVSCWNIDTDMAYLNDIKAEFNKVYPDIEVEYIDIPSADYSSKLSIDLNGGAASDVVLIKDADTIYTFAGKGQLLSLNDLISRDGMDLGMFNGVADYFNYDNKQFGLPISTGFYILYYNKDIFDAAGEPYPGNDMTWEQFEATAKKLTQGSGADKIYGAHLHTWQACVENWAVQAGKGTIMGPDYEFMRPYYEMALRMQDADKSIQDFATLKTGNIHYSSAFYSGNVAMMPMGTWFMATLIGKINEGEVDINWGISTLPHGNGEAAGEVVGSTTPIAINAASANQELAWEFLKFFVSDEGQQCIADKGLFPSRMTDALRATIAGIDGMPPEAGKALEVKNITLDRPIEPMVNEVNQMLGEEHGLVMLGESTIDKFIETITVRSAEIQGQ